MKISHRRVSDSEHHRRFLFGTFTIKRLYLIFGLLGIAPVAVLLLSTACGRQANAPATRAAQQASVPNEFVGNATCKECHAAEFAAHHNSRHAQTLRFMDRKSLGAQAPPAGRVPNTRYAITDAQNGGYRFGLAGGRAFPLHLVFGSGKSGMAFTTAVSDTILAEARISYFPPRKHWYITPGMANMPDNSMGNISQGEAARQCLECHTVTLPKNSLMPSEKFMGVGCEACHGPAGRHVAAMRSGGGGAVQMERLGSLGATRVIELCGRCHRTARDVTTKKLPPEHTDLFQAHGLEQSRCFRESRDQLSCVTCHNPHTNARTDEASYVAACLKCHAATTPPTGNGDGRRLVQAHLCPVNPRDSCVGCHMPKRAEPVFPGSPRRVADHFIRVNSEGSSAPPAAAR